MSDAKLSYAFSISNNMWYDISTGDILSEASAVRLLNQRFRVADYQHRLLAVNVMQFGSFMHKVGKQSKSQPVKIIDRWSRDNIAVRIKARQTLLVFREYVEKNSIPITEQGHNFIIPRDYKHGIVEMLISEGCEILYASKQDTAPKVIKTFQNQYNVKGQDRIFKLMSEDCMLFAICDGHGDNAAIDYISSHKLRFTELIAEPFPTTQEEAFVRTRKVFVMFENEMRSKANCIYSGSTMVFAAHNMKTRKVFFGYIGDSRAVYQYDKTSDIIATQDHKPSDAGETKRVVHLGGVVTYHKNDVPRVNGNLATSRAFGDESLKSKGNDRTLDLVSVIPDVIGPFNFHENSVYLMASDGLFDEVKNTEVIKALRSEMEFAEISTKLITTAKLRGSRDDISVGFVVSS